MAPNNSETKRQCHVLHQKDDKIHGKNNDKELDEIRQNVCFKPDELTSFDQRNYCIFHLPTKTKDGFETALKQRLLEINEKEFKSEASHLADETVIKSHYLYDFRYVWFPTEVDFRRYEFSGAVNFSSAVFEDDVKFYQAKFDSDTFFDNVKFNKDASFNSVIFNKESDVFFRFAFFARYVSFKYATAEGYLRFSNIEFGKEGRLSFKEAAFEKASRISFLKMCLHPSWFIGVDSRKMVFTDIDWKNVNNNFKNENLFAELNKLKAIKEENPKHVFKIACRQLAENAENNSNFEIASNFRRLSMETEWYERIERVKEKPDGVLDFLRKLRDIPIYALYRFSSSYGERWGRAFLVLILILGFFALIYTQVDFYNFPKEKPVSLSLDDCKKAPSLPMCEKKGLPLDDAILHTLTTATFQNVDYRKPANFGGELWVMLEKIFAPLQAALLALAIRRKFMR